MRKVILAISVVLTFTAAVSAQTPAWRFQWKEGQVLNYRVEHVTDVYEVIGGNKVESKARINLVKRWEVTAVDGDGVATIRMSIVQMRNEQTRPGGEVLLFDSQAPDKCTPELAEQMSKFIGQTLAELRVDGLGKVVSVTKGAVNRYEAEPPFLLTLPPAAVTVDQSWSRDYGIARDAAHGEGEKFAAQQKYGCTKIDGGLATFSLSTALMKSPETKAEELPLLQKLPQGEIVFDVEHGRLQSGRLTIDREVAGHQGEGSIYRIQSVYVEQIVE